MLTVVVDRLAHRPDANGDAGLRDLPALPDLFSNLVLRYHPVAVANQMYQKGKHLRRQPHGDGATRRFEPLRVKSKFAKCPCHAAEYCSAR